MAILNQLNTKPTWVKQGANLAATLNMSINTDAHDATGVIVTFDCYRDISLKQANTASMNIKRAPCAFHISVSSNIDKVA